MRMPRFKADKEAPFGHYHCISRVVDRRRILGPVEREHFVRLMRGYETFCGVRILTFCILSNHFHILVEVPKRPPAELLPDDAELVRRVRVAKCSYPAKALKDDLKRLHSQGQHKAAEELRERFFCRMWDISWFMKLLKQRFSQWYNRRNNRKGTLWEERFRSTLLEGEYGTLMTVAAYNDLNPIRARMADDPKDYRWCGYGQAVAGGKLAREGLRTALHLPKEVPVKAVLAQYRSFLFHEGIEIKPGANGEKGRRGFNLEEIQAVLDKGGQLKLGEAVCCRLRYLCDGGVLGSRAFVDRYFHSHRQWFGARRKDGARPLKGIKASGLYVIRSLRVKPIG